MHLILIFIIPITFFKSVYLVYSAYFLNQNYYTYSISKNRIDFEIDIIRILSSVFLVISKITEIGFECETSLMYTNSILMITGMFNLRNPMLEKSENNEIEPILNIETSAIPGSEALKFNITIYEMGRTKEIYNNAIG